MPCQLMVGFFAYAKTFEINVDKEELEGTLKPLLSSLSGTWLHFLFCFVKWDKENVVLWCPNNHHCISF